MNSTLQYLVFEAKDGAAQRQQRLQLLRKMIVDRNLQQALPMIRYETGRQLVYFAAIALDPEAFDGVRAAEDAAIDLVRACYGRAPSTTYVIPDLQGLVKLLRGAVGGKGYTQSLKFERDESGTRRADALADAAETGEIVDGPDGDEPGRALAHNRLLHWSTANGSGDLAKFDAAARLLGAVAEQASLWSLIRGTLLLGHLEFARTASGWRWSTAPRTVLKPVVGGSPFIAGQRLVSDARGDGTERTPQCGGPDRLANAAWPASGSAELIARRLPALDDWIASIPPWGELDFHGYTIERIGDGGWTEHVTVPDAESSDVHRFTRNERPVYAWFDTTRRRWVTGDPMSLQFIHRAKAGLAVAAPSIGDDLLVPRCDRWPLPYERALVQASGLLPTLARDPQGRAILKYRGVPVEFASALAGKLQVKIGDQNA